MAIYIGKREYKMGRMIMSHVASDDICDLHEFADKMGIDRKHFQDKPGKPHYDICKSKKQIALQYFDAKLVDDREIIKMFQRQKESQNAPPSEFAKRIQEIYKDRPVKSVGFLKSFF